MLGVAGESGCGKSTLGRAVLQLIPSTAGRVTWLGEDIAGLDEKGLGTYLAVCSWCLARAHARTGDEIADAYENCDYNRAMRRVMELADRANPYVESKEPWVLAKSDSERQRLNTVMYNLAESLRLLALVLRPVMPQTAAKMPL